MVFVGPASDKIFVPECQVCGLDWACHGRNFGAPFCKAHGLCWACLGLPPTHFQFAILPVYAGPAAVTDGMSCSFLSSRVLNE